MVTWRSSQMIESPRAEGVGNTFVSVAVGWVEGVSGRAVVLVSPAVEQAASVSSPRRKTLDIIFIVGPGCPSNFNTQDGNSGLKPPSPSGKPRVKSPQVLYRTTAFPSPIDLLIGIV